MNPPPRIGLALSGGGSRAMAFHLGCLRALHDHDLLRHVRVVSGVSGGAVLAALWAYGPSSFDEFDTQVTALLRRGFQGEILRRVLSPIRLARGVTSAARVMLAQVARRSERAIRSMNRTDALIEVLEAVAFGDKTLAEVTHPNLDVVLTATDLRTSNAVRFGSARSACSRYGVITDQVTIAMAAAASAAYPVVLPAVERRMTFVRGGNQRTEPVLLSDGGLYDNLGLSVLLPGRSRQFTEHVYDLDYVIACDAGRGQLQPKVPHFLLGRLIRGFEVTHRRAQDGGRAQLHHVASANLIQGFVLAYLGMPDERLPVPLTDLVPRHRVATYPTNFAGMPPDAFEALSLRGEQLVRVLLPAYCAPLVGFLESEGGARTPGSGA